MSNDNVDYLAAYERQKLARERAEDLLENRSRELYDSQERLRAAYENLSNQKAQLLHQEKLASIGQLSAGIAHEINNPAGFVKSNLTSLKEYTQQLSTLLALYQQQSHRLAETHPELTNSELWHHIEKMEADCDVEYLLEDIPVLIGDSIEGAGRITEIVNGLKNFSRIDSETKEPLDVNHCIENTIKLVQNEIKYKATLVLNLGDLPLTAGYPGSLGQVILNILVNATHAIEDFGEISIVTTVVTKADVSSIVIRLSDNGCGMSEEVRNKIFDPFYTTKEVGVGTGLGLSISAGIIKQHEGLFEVESEIDKGTCFTISLPIISEYS